jgi:hypothetical protein
MHAHPGALTFLQFASSATHPGLGKAETGCNSCVHLVDGQGPRPTRSKGTYPKDTVRVELMVWSLKQTTGLVFTAID